MLDQTLIGNCFQREYNDRLWAREKSVKAEKRDRNAERERKNWQLFYWQIIIPGTEAPGILYVSDFSWAVEREKERERERERRLWRRLISRWIRKWSCIWLPRPCVDASHSQPDSVTEWLDRKQIYSGARVRSLVQESGLWKTDSWKNAKTRSLLLERWDREIDFLTMEKLKLCVR